MSRFEQWWEGQPIEPKGDGLNPKGDILVVKRRKYRRIWVKLPLNYPPAESEEIFGRVALDASEGGLRGHLSRTIEIGIS
jgi:hypothetical protein